MPGSASQRIYRVVIPTPEVRSCAARERRDLLFSSSGHRFSYVSAGAGHVEVPDFSPRSSAFRSCEKMIATVMGFSPGARRMS